jgi:hypothetical protein
MRKATAVALVVTLAVIAAFAVDEWSYWSWRTRMAAAASRFEASVRENRTFWSGELASPSGFISNPNIAFIASYQPPSLAWTYHISMHSRIGYAVASSYTALKQTVLGARVPVEFRVEHSPFQIGVRRCMSYDPCSPKDAWLPYVEHQVGSF